MFLIYRYTAPDGRVYIGCTARTLEARAGDNGIQYKDATKFWKAIQEFGWENFKVDILETTEDAAEATRLEDRYILKYHSLDIRYGFNSSKSGGAKTLETRRKQSETMKQTLNDSNSYFRSEERYLKQSAAIKESHSRPEVREKLSKARLGKVWVHRFTDGILEKKVVTPEESIEYLNSGWQSGMGPRSK